MDIQDVITFFFSIVLISGGIIHFVKTKLYYPFIPDFFPKRLINAFIGILEIILGIALLVPKLQAIASAGVFVLMVLFLPIHVEDAFKHKPVIGSRKFAIIRVPIQLLLIWLAWFMNHQF